VLAPLTPLVFISALVVAAVAAREKGVDFEFDRTTGPERVLRLARGVGLMDVGVCRCVPDLDTSFVLPGGFRTGASVYYGRGDGARPAVLLIHGNTWLGRHLSTYRLKARLLADAGFTVLAYDQVGFGDAEDRFKHGAAGLPAAYDFYGQASAALEFLMRLVPLDGDAGVTVKGHSGGVDVALYLGHANPAVNRVVIMVAPPPPMEGENAQAERGAYFSARAAHTYRSIHEREWPDWFEWDMTQADERDPSQLYRQDGHPPVLLVLGERDEPRGHPAVLAMYEEIAGPKDLAWLPRSNHYLNTAQSLGFVFFDRRVARHFRTAVVDRLSEGFGDMRVLQEGG
jgi:pimeloyl-ACP methyl ester carboxylesterase